MLVINALQDNFISSNFTAASLATDAKTELRCWQKRIKKIINNAK